MAQAARKADHDVLPPEQSEETRALVLRVQTTPALVLTDSATRDQFFDAIKAECDAFVPDVSTQKGRDQVRALASKVTKTKTAIDKARLELTAEMRERIGKINAEGKEIVDRFDALSDAVRQPLTDWELAEKRRKEEADRIIGEIQLASVVREGETSTAVAERAMDLRNLVLDEKTFGVRFEMVCDLRNTTIQSLDAAVARIRQAEEDAAELARLRAAEEERIRLAEEQAAAARAEEERKAYEEREKAKREAAAQLEAELVERERQEAAEAARREAQAKAQREIEELERKRQAEVDAANERARLAEEAAEAERQRIAAAEAARIAEQERLAEEQRQREADQAHRRQVKTRAKQAIMSCGATEDVAQKIVLAIIAGEVPAVRLEF